MRSVPTSAFLLRATLALATLTLAACSDGATPVDVDPGPDPDPRSTLPDLTWLEANAVPFATDAPGSDFADLLPLAEMIGDARVVALGEATHGTREFFRMKHRVLEFLVREMGFTVFGIEAAWGESLAVNDYVHTGLGDPAARLAGLGFWTWNTQEVLDQIHWMRAHNAGAAGSSNPVSFFGFDMQSSRPAMDLVSQYLVSADPGSMTVVGPEYDCWRTWSGAATYWIATDSIRQRCRAGVEAVHDLVAERRVEYEAVSSPEAYARALRAARVVVQHEHLHSRRWSEVEPNPRERYMAENAEWLLEQSGPDGRVVLWAHNLHVMDESPWMGSFLRERYGDDVVIVGFSFHEGELNAFPVSQGQFVGPVTALAAPPAEAGSLGHAFGGLDHPRFYVDLRPLRAGSEPSANWLLAQRPFRNIGATYDPEHDGTYYRPLRPAHNFDVLIHFRDTRPSVLLPFVTE